jgi:membrane-bound serine protease (ClpP class)
VGLGWAHEVEDWDALMREIGASGAPVQEMATNWAERLVRILTHPAVAPMLLSLGFLGLFVELKSPGLGLPGAVGILSISLFFGSHLLIGLAGLEGILLFFAGLALIALEVFVIPGTGIAGFLGVAGVLGGLFLSLVGDLPTTADLAQGAGTLTLALLIVAVGFWFIIRSLPANTRLGRLGIFLTRSTSRATGYASAARREDLLGKEGVAATDLRPSGTGLFDDERIDVVSESEWIEHGTKIRIVASEGYRQVVRAVKVEQSS